MDASVLVWMTPTLGALIFWGLGQGLIKKFINEVPPARFCLFFIVAKSLVNLGYFFTQKQPLAEGMDFADFRFYGMLAYLLDGAAWILYFQSIVHGPITIVGTLSAAYPAISVVMARVFLGETLTSLQYSGVVLVILSCIGLSYSPPDRSDKKTSKKWIPMAVGALLIWGASQTLQKRAYMVEGSSEAYMSLFNTVGGLFTLGVYGMIFGRLSKGVHAKREWAISFFPMAVMALGDLAALIAYKLGPVSIVSPVSGAYPVVTLGFAQVFLNEKITKLQWFCIGLIIVGVLLSTGT